MSDSARPQMATYTDVIAYLAAGDISTDQYNRIVAVLKSRAKTARRAAIKNLRVGARVEWDSRSTGRVVRGTVMKLGRSVATVLADGGMTWRVTATLLRGETK